jgi:hypothetical protein
VASEKDKRQLSTEFRRALERIGVPEAEAQQLARRNFESTDAGTAEICQHVVPVSRGWLVIRDYPNQDIGLFTTKEDALLDAHALADASGLTVRVHDRST